MFANLNALGAENVSFPAEFQALTEILKKYRTKSGG